MNLNDAFLVERAPREFRRNIPMRRAGSFSLPTTAAGMNSISEEFQMADALFEFASLPDFIGCSNAEPTRRPIPEVFPAKETDALTATVLKWLPRVLEWLFKQVEPPWQSYNAVSRIGGPFYTPYDDKKFILERLVPAYLSGDFRIMEAAFVQIGGRIAEETLEKKREYTYISKEGQVYRAVLDRRADPVRVWGHMRFPARYRNVFNQPVFNLIKQIVDSALHDVYLRHEAFSHNIHTMHHKIKGPILALDVSRFERATARIVLERGRLIGGPYGECQERMFKTPFLVIADDWRTPFLLKPNIAGGYMVQFGSGDSAVAASQKDTFMCALCEFAVTRLGVPESTVIDWVAAGGDDRLGIANYGDDNFYWSAIGDQSVLDDVLAFLKTILAVTIEEPPGFLGATWWPDLHRFLLTRKSYIAKTYLNERGPFPPFRRYPFMGMIAKRAVYATHGDPFLTKQLFPYEDELWRKNGISFNEISRFAQAESVEMNRDAREAREYFTSEAYLLGKQDYMLNHEIKVRAGAIAGYTGFTPGETAPILARSVDPRWGVAARFDKLAA